jgi:hypothetical protein
MMWDMPPMRAAIKGIGHVFYLRWVTRMTNNQVSQQRRGAVFELNEEQIATISGGKGCKLAAGQAGHALGDRHQGESTGAAMWRAVAEIFFGGDHCG